MSAVAQDKLAAGREAFSAQQWERAFELLSVADAAQALAPEDLECLADAACWSRRYDEMLELLERAEAGFERDGYSASEPHPLALKGLTEPLDVVEVGWR
jgi:hypothetical protein